MSEPLTPDERALFEQTFAELQAREAEVATLQRNLIEAQRQRSAAEANARGLRMMLRSLAETTQRSAFRLDVESVEDGGMRVTMVSTAGEVMEKLQARIAGAVMSALFLDLRAVEADDVVAPDPEAPAEPTPAQRDKAELRQLILGGEA
jgi:hypothetical protein